MIYGVRGVFEISHNCYFSKHRSTAASLFAINNGFPIIQFTCQPFFNVFRLNYFGTIYKFCLSEKAASLDLLTNNNNNNRSLFVATRVKKQTKNKVKDLTSKLGTRMKTGRLRRDFLGLRVEQPPGLLFNGLI